MSDLTTYNDDQIDAKARAVYMKALKKMDAILDSDQVRPETMQALAACASAACEGIVPENGMDDEHGI